MNAGIIEGLLEVATDLKRKPFIWDNSISNDSKVRTQHLYLDPSGGAWELADDLVAGLAVNPMNQAHLTRIALCRLRRMLAKEPASADCLRSHCGPITATQLEQDAELMRKGGLGEMDLQTRQRLLARYESMDSSPYAHEVAAWLRNEYSFDPQCLTD